MLQQLHTLRDAGHPLVVCYGGGVDSTAMLIALRDAGIVPDLITFADVGGEKPETYEYVRTFSRVIQGWGFPAVTWVRHRTSDQVDYDDLEGNCLANETLPSLAFGMKSCSLKWKADPQDKYLKGCSRGANARPAHPIWTLAQVRGVRVVKLIGYDAGPADLRRSKNLRAEDEEFLYRYPLQDLGWTRGDCVAAILAAGLDVPLKSACWFCPASKAWELWWLAGAHPDLFERALELERRALTGKHSRYDAADFGGLAWEEMIRSAERFPSVKTTVGLGRKFAWNRWAIQNGVADAHGKVIASAQHCLAQSDALRDDDNALDTRSCYQEAA